jgi:hypothetical protein
MLLIDLATTVGHHESDVDRALWSLRIRPNQQALVRHEPTIGRHFQEGDQEVEGGMKPLRLLLE